MQLVVEELVEKELAGRGRRSRLRLLRWRSPRLWRVVEEVVDQLVVVEEMVDELVVVEEMLDELKSWWKR